MNEYKHQLLVDHLDLGLQGKVQPEAQLLIATEPESRQHAAFLLQAKDAINHVALYDLVGAIRAERNGIRKPATVISMGRKISYAAAAILVMALSLGIFKYATTTPTKIFEENFSGYELSTARSGAVYNDIETAYRNKDWQKVLTVFNSMQEKDNKALFLAGMAAMELNELAIASHNFESILNSKNALFRDEASYYLALSSIASNDIARAKELLNSIKADPEHLYHQKAGNVNTLDLSILSLKN